MHSAESKDIQQHIKRLKELPTLPLVISKIIRVLHDEKASMQELVCIIRHDPSLSSKIVAMANAPFFGYQGKINSIEQAILMLGFDLVKSITVSVSIFSIFPVSHQVLKRIWAHSYAVAALSGLLAARLPGIHNGMSFLAGLLHDVGRIVLLSLSQTAQAAEALYSLGRKDRELGEEERALLGCSHTDAGRIFLEDLYLPDEIYLPVQHHHDGFADEAELGGMVRTIYFAEGLLGLIRPDPFCDGQWTEEHGKLFVECGYSTGDMDDYRAFFSAEEHHIDAFFELGP